MEGSHLGRFLQGKICLQQVRSNKVLVVVNKADYQSVNAVSAARATLGLDAEILELRLPLQLIARKRKGQARGWAARRARRVSSAPPRSPVVPPPWPSR